MFSDADNDALTITASSSDNGKATVSVASDGSTLTLTGVAEGTATITVTADDGNGGNRFSDTFHRDGGVNGAAARRDGARRRHTHGSCSR